MSQDKLQEQPKELPKEQEKKEPVLDLATIFEDAKKKESETDFPAAVLLYETLLKNNYIDSFKNYSKILFFGKPAGEKFAKVEKDEYKAIKLLTKYVEQNQKDVESLKLIGSCYMNGVGVSEDEEIALGAYEKAAELGDVPSMVTCGNLCLKKDAIKSVLFYEKAIDNGSVEACSLLGALYYTGIGKVPLDYEKSISFFKKGVERGDLESYSYLGFDSFNGINKNEKLAIEYFEKGVEKGSTNCMFYLGEIYFRGKSPVTKDIIKGIDLLIQSRKLGNERASLFIENEIESKMTIEKMREIELNDRLIDSISKKDLKKFTELIEQGANVDGYHITEPLISFVVKKDLFEFFKLLIEKGANVNATDSVEPFNPISLNIISYKQVKYLKYLLDLPKEEGFLVNKTSSTGISILIASIISKNKEFIEMIMKDGRINLKIKSNNKVALEFIKDDKDLEEFYKSLLVSYRRSIYSGDKVYLFNLRTQNYIGLPEVNSDNWEAGKLTSFPISHILIKSKEGQLHSNEIIKIKTTRSFHDEFNTLYSSSGGWGFYDKNQEDEKKQDWKIVKLNLLKEDGFTREHEIFTGDIIRFENVYYQFANLYASTNHFLATSYYFTDQWVILKDK